jgi:hypothetical protein
MIEHFDGVDYRHQFDSTAFRDAAGRMLEHGFAFDYISDKQIARLATVDHELHTSGNSVYRVLVLPRARYMPIAMLRKAVQLAAQGATVIAYGGMPENTAGFANRQANEQALDSLRQRLSGGTPNAAGRETRIGRGRWLEGNDLEALLTLAGARRETMIDKGIHYLRKGRTGDRTLYLLANRRNEPFEGWLPLASEAPAAVVYNTWTGVYGQTAVRQNKQRYTEVYIQIDPGQTMILELYPHALGTAWYPFYTRQSPAVPVQGRWYLSFDNGGPVLPPNIAADSLASWTAFGPAYQAFSGTATYRITFPRPNVDADAWLLDLGRVCESASVRINGKPIGTVVGPAYRLLVEKNILEQHNSLEISVANLMANRIADLDRRGIFWKKFYNVNVAARKPENRKDGIFDTSTWEPKPSGLLGPVTLSALRRR